MAVSEAITRGKLLTIYVKLSAYHNSFLPFTVREMKVCH